MHHRQWGLLFVVLTALLTASTALLANSGGRATVANAGNTGAPGESLTCITCHSTSTSFDPVEVQASFLDQNGMPALLFIAGETYTLTIAIQHTGSPAGFGFQATILDGEDNSVGNFSNPSANTQIAQTTGAISRQYVEHGGGTSASNVFTVDWTAPFISGPVFVYAAGNAVNFDGGTGGDGAAVEALTFSQQQSILVFDDREEFLAATAAFVASAPYTVGDTPAEPFTSGDVSFVSGASSSLNFANWTGVDFPQDNDVELALNGTEDLDILANVGLVSAMGVDFEDLSGGNTPSTFTVTGLDNNDLPLFGFQFDTPDLDRDFIGVWSSEAFKTLRIRESSAANENEFFGTVFSTLAPIFQDDFEAP